jgi:hypothetical protein
MLLQRLGLNFSANQSRPDQRHCYVSVAQLEKLLEAPGALEMLLLELTGRTAKSASTLEQLACLRQSAIHLAVTRSPFTGLSLEEIVVACAFDSKGFEGSSWKQEVTRQVSASDLQAACLAWLLERTQTITDGHAIRRPHWPLIGLTSRTDDWHFLLAVSPVASASQLEQELCSIAAEADFAHEHYLACSPATALSYVSLHAHAGPSVRWDAFALDRKLRSYGIGLLLVEPSGILLYLPARYQPHSAPVKPPPLGSAVAAKPPR